MDAKKKEREAWEIDDLELLRQQAADNGSLSAKQAYINGLEYELRAALAQPAQGKCETCNGLGMIGGFVRTGSGEGSYDGESCPDCSTNDRNMAHQPANTITVTVAEYEEIKRDAERYRWLRDGTPTWDVDLADLHGKRLNSAERFACLRSKNWECTLASWRVEFFTEYGRSSDEYNLDAAIDAAKSTGEDV